MRKEILYTLIFFILVIPSSANAQEDTNEVYMNSGGMTLDSLYGIVNNPLILYKEKMSIFYGCYQKRNSQQEKQTSVLNTLLSESKSKKDYDGLLYCYIYLADLNKEWNNEDLFNIYLDSAELYAEDSKNPLSLAGYHYTKGTQAINAPYGKKEG